MKKNLMMFGTAGLLAAVLMVSGCGSNDDSSTPVGTTTSTAATTTTTTSTAATTTTTAVPTTTTTTVPATSVTVPTTGGTYDATGADKTYTLTAGAYTATITGFAAGDKLIFPAGLATPSVQNNSDSDGSIVITWSVSPAQTIIVNLPAMNNSLLFSAARFNSVLGTGTVQY